MSIPRVQPLLLPVLKKVGEGTKQSLEEIRNHAVSFSEANFNLTDAEAQETYPKSGTNKLVIRVAWALAHLVMGKAIERRERGYQITERGLAILRKNPSELTIRELH